jgi:tripartite-type tricarboxylate transporter receptor subunit TctC
MAVNTFYVVVRPDSPWNSVADLVRAARENSKGLIYGSHGKKLMRTADPVFVGWALVPTATVQMMGTSAYRTFHPPRMARSAVGN